LPAWSRVGNFAKPDTNAAEAARPTSAVGPPVTDEHSRHKLLLFR
jgi:hypothetical protein